MTGKLQSAYVIEWPPNVLKTYSRLGKLLIKFSMCTFSGKLSLSNLFREVRLLDRYTSQPTTGRHWRYHSNKTKYWHYFLWVEALSLQHWSEFGFSDILLVLIKWKVEDKHMAVSYSQPKMKKWQYYMMGIEIGKKC